MNRKTIFSHKLACILALTILCTAFSACSQGDPQTTDATSATQTSVSSETEQTGQVEEPEQPRAAFDGTMDEILTALVSRAGEIDSGEYGITAIAVSNVPVDEDSCTDILGLTTEEFQTLVEEAIESKPDGSWFTHSVVVVRVKDGVDVKTTAEKIVANTKGARFGCLKPEAIVGGYSGNVVFFCTSSAETAEAVYQAFCELSALKTVRIDRENDWSGGTNWFEDME